MPFHAIIRAASVVDGTGETPPFTADVGVAGDRITAIGDLSSATADHDIDGSGLTLAPGFIDVHVHSEISLLGGRDQLSTLRQGVTTHLLAPDGFGWAPLPPQLAREFWAYAKFAYGDLELSFDWPTAESYLDLFPGNTPANVYPQVPHCAVRLNAMGWDARPATDDEIARMEDLTREWMDAGAGCLCLGLDYQPSAHADTRELVALCRVAASYGGIYAAHQRFQLLGHDPAWRETMELSRLAEIPVHVSHSSVNGQTIPLLEECESEEIDLTIESYLYPAGMTHVVMMLPMDVQAGNNDTVLGRMRDPATRARSLPHLKDKLGPKGNQIVGHTRSGRYCGMTLAEAASEAGKSWEEFAYDLVLEEDAVEAFVFPWQVPTEEIEPTMQRTAAHPRVMVASDGVYDVPHPHPRSLGCFSRFLRRYVRELGVISLEEAVYKMSGFPAQRFGLRDRGQIGVGKAADLVLLDTDIVTDRSTFQDPLQESVGVQAVMVNGSWVILEGKATGALPGRVLQRS